MWFLSLSLSATYTFIKLKFTVFRKPGVLHMDQYTAEIEMWGEERKGLRMDLVLLTNQSRSPWLWRNILLFTGSVTKD